MLAGALESERVSHAYLFHGPEGTGKRAMAISFAAALLCKEREAGRACASCNSCERVRKLVHPDVHFLFPAPGDTNEDVFAERLQILGANPYETTDFERKPVLNSSGRASGKRVIYSVEHIHKNVHRALGFTAVEGGYRIVILSDADRLMVQAANALLKILEEPRPRTVLILTTEQPDQLLSTIRSRCQGIRFDRLTDDEIVTALEKRNDIDAASAAIYARMADGSFSRALDLAVSSDLIELRSNVVAFLRMAYACKAPEVVNYAEELQRLSREQLRFFYRLLLLWLRDLLLQKILGDTARILNVDQADAIRKFVANLPHANIESMIEAVEEAHRLVDRNINSKLGLMVLATTLSSAMRGEKSSPLVTSLSASM